MKKIYNHLLFAAIAIFGLTISSCYKKFDASSYAPPLNIGGYTSARDVAASNLVAYWGFNGTLIDSVSSTSATNTGTTFSNGIKSQSLQTTGNSYIVVNTPAAIQNLKSFSVTSWVYAPQNSTGIAGILDVANTNSFWGNLTIFFENGPTATTGQLKIHVNNNGADAWLGNYTVQNPWNTWMNVAVTYDAASSTFKVFVNGSKIATQTIANFGNLVFQNATKMVFGTVQFQTTPSLTSATTSQPWASYLNGQIDEVRIYNRALTENELGSLVKLEGRGK